MGMGSKAKAGEYTEQAALREVIEETRWECEIVSELGSHASGLGNTAYFLMSAFRECADFGREVTAAIAGVTPAGALAMTSETGNGKARKRDLAGWEAQ